MEWSAGNRPLYRTGVSSSTVRRRSDPIDRAFSVQDRAIRDVALGKVEPVPSIEPAGDVFVARDLEGEIAATEGPPPVGARVEHPSAESTPAVFRRDVEVVDVDAFSCGDS